MLAHLKNQLKEYLLARGLYVKRITNLPRGIDWILDAQRLLSLGPRPVCVDVGANVGSVTLDFKKHLPNSTVFAFEPVSSTFQQLQEATRHLTNVHCCRVALSDRQGVQTIQAVPGSVFNSLKSDIFSNERTAQTEEVKLVTLDQFACDRDITSFDIVKTDTEGYDLEVLKGAHSLLESGAIRAVYAEVTFATGNVQNTLFDLVYDYLEGLRFRFCGLYELYYFQVKPWETSFCSALFVHERHIAQLSD